MKQIYDNHGRPVNYLRLAVTDRCNLRCFYCMPEHGIQYLPKKELLTFGEIERLVRVLAGMGISKIRLTGGEPFIRKNLMLLIRMIKNIPGVKEIHLTTNGLLTGPYIPELKQMGISSVNLSLDSIDAERFKIITRRNELARVMATFYSLLDHGIAVKINAVVMQDKNIEDILPLIELGKNHNVSVRFIEEMPFNGEGNHYASLTWTYNKILKYIKSHHRELQKIPTAPYATAGQYQVPGYKGTIGIIAAFSRTFCGTCNRIRVTAQGELKTCLYDQGVLSVRDLIRTNASDEQLAHALVTAMGNRAENGFEAEQRRLEDHSMYESMSSIGG